MRGTAHGRSSQEAAFRRRSTPGSNRDRSASSGVVGLASPAGVHVPSTVERARWEVVRLQAAEMIEDGATDAQGAAVLPGESGVSVGRWRWSGSSSFG
jgi:hypothetical protein